MRLLSTQSDERLVLLARHGHDFAFEELVRRYREPLTRYLRRLLGPSPVASDALERGLIRAWAALLDGSVPVEARSWLYGNVHAAAIGSLAARAKLRPEQAGDDEAETSAQAAGLTQRQRSALVLAVRGCDPDAAARSLGLDDGLLARAADRARAAGRGFATALVPSRALFPAAAARL